MQGKQVQSLVNEVRERDEYAVTLDAAILGSGVYFYQLRIGKFSETQKLVFLK